MLGVMLRIIAFGRSRAARKLVEPDVVYVTTAAIGNSPVMTSIAAQIDKSEKDLEKLRSQFKSLQASLV